MKIPVIRTVKKKLEKSITYFFLKRTLLFLKRMLSENVQGALLNGN